MQNHGAQGKDFSGFSTDGGGNKFTKNQWDVYNRAKTIDGLSTKEARALAEEAEATEGAALTHWQEQARTMFMAEPHHKPFNDARAIALALTLEQWKAYLTEEGLEYVDAVPVVKMDVMACLRSCKTGNAAASAAPKVKLNTDQFEAYKTLINDGVDDWTAREAVALSEPISAKPKFSRLAERRLMWPLPTLLAYATCRRLGDDEDAAIEGAERSTNFVEPTIKKRPASDPTEPAKASKPSSMNKQREFTYTCDAKPQHIEASGKADQPQGGCQGEAISTIQRVR